METIKHKVILNLDEKDLRDRPYLIDKFTSLIKEERQEAQKELLEKVEKLFEELWDGGNISYKELEAINSLLVNGNVNLNERWNILKGVRRLD